MASLVNAMTVDVEDYFQVSAFADVIPQSAWSSYESRVCQNTERLLTLFDKTGVRATFFVLGWVAEQFPQLVKRINREGHELASHSHHHRLVYDMTPEEFVADVRRARHAIGDATGVGVHGFRAPSYSITERSLWALDALIDEGYTFDSSIYPIRHDRYGIPTWPRHVHRIERARGSLWELPGSTVRHVGVNLPTGGGGYFRLLPYRWTRHGVATLNGEGQPAIFYLHPWEIDPEQPRVNGIGRVSRFRHYTNLHRTEARLRRLLTDFRFGPIADVLARREATAQPVVQPGSSSAA